MIIRAIHLLWLLIICSAATGQRLHRPLAAFYTGLGAYSIGHVDLFSFTANQASLARLKQGGIALYGERKFMLSELSSYTAALGLPTSSGNFGLRASYAGFSEYNESLAGIAYGRKLGDRLDIGAQFNYNAIRIAGYGNATALSFELGAIVHVTEKLHAGIHANNPVGGKFGKDRQEKLASVYTAGFGYEASDKFFISTEIVKEEEQPVNVNAGLQYRFVPSLLARAGVSTSVSTAWMGVGLSWKSFRADLTASYHQQLGLTPGLLLIYHFKTKEE